VFPFGLGLLAFDVCDALASGRALTITDDALLTAQLILFAVGTGGAAAAAWLTMRRCGYRVRPVDLLSLAGYWVLLCIATVSSLGELMSSPHHWNKTRHGLAIRLERPLAKAPGSQPRSHGPKSGLKGSSVG
jgi:hypothetical protein